MSPAEVIRLLIDQLERQNRLLMGLAAAPVPDPYRDLKVFLLGLLLALVVGFVGRRMTARREEESRKLREWARVRDWHRHGRRDDLSGIDLTPTWHWLRLRLPEPLARLLARPRYLDLAHVRLGQDDTHPEGAAALSRARLPLAYLYDARLRGADLSGATLAGAFLAGADLRQADLVGADLQGAILTMTNLQAAALTAANFRGAKLVEANLQDAKLVGAIFQGARLTMADLRGARLALANFRSALLAMADLREAVLWGADLERADLRWADLSTARDLGEARLDRARANAKTQWPEGFQVPNTVVMVRERGAETEEAEE